MAAPARTPLGEVVTPRRLVTVALVALAAVVSIVGLQKTNTSTRAIPCGPVGPIVRFLPCPGDSDLRQGIIGAQMAGGWRLDLYVDNTPVPQDELTVEGSNYYFKPGPGTATGALAPGNHTARIVYYRDLASEADGEQKAWSFSTH
jgi:hypothetical protein